MAPSGGRGVGHISADNHKFMGNDFCGINLLVEDSSVFWNSQAQKSNNLFFFFRF